MKDIKAILAEAGIEAEVADKVAAEVKANYRTVAEWQKKVDRIAELEQSNADLAEAAAAVEGTSQEVEALKAKLKGMEEAETARKAAEAESKKRDDFRKSFDEALGGRKFANGIVEESVFDKAYAHCTANAGSSAKDAIEALTKDAEGVWVNPQHDPRRMPTNEQLSTSRGKDAQTKSFLDALFG